MLRVFSCVTIIPMKKLKEYILEAKKEKKAVGHFNISNLEGLKGIVSAARSLDLPVIIGVSEGERDFIGVKQAVALVRSLREELNYPIFINADHTYSFERVKEAVDAGFDSVIFDGAKLSLEENIKITKQCVEYARSVNPEILIEGELGYIGQSSKILDEIPEGAAQGASLTSTKDALRFVKETRIDLFAPAVGNIHGMLRDIPDPRLDISRIKDISEACGIPLVLHGGSGNIVEDFQNAILNGVSIVHINTEIRVAYRDALKNSLETNPDEVAPYKFALPGVLAVEKVVKEKLKIFNRSL